MDTRVALSEAIQAIKSGDRQKWKTLLVGVIQADPQNETAWLWMSACVAADKDREHCLRKVLAINPNNQAALQGLGRLAAKASAAPAAPEKKSYTVQAPVVKRKSTKRKVITWALLILASLCLCALLFPLGAFIGTQDIEYVVSGSADNASITYINSQGGMEQRTVNVPWRHQVEMKAGSYVSLIATNNGYGSIACEIRLNGTAWKKSVSTAPFGFASCAGTIGGE